VALVAKFNDVHGHNFVINHLKLKSSWLKIRKTTNFFADRLKKRLATAVILAIKSA
jgi:hypothetical protein